MPQLLPFYFLNQISFRFFGLFIMIYIFSRYILPSFIELFITRMFITKL
uniref:ATP synthase protein 8 n=2 Tax=Tilletia TaxID=13289 RepID=A8DU66_9BASI|nr:ATP synthase F0 subunit 8 [Tilletia indica]YP_001876492.1 ATP8 [Tilletia walkeri]YP_010758778.1 ATP synthase F0 subunit 8 [Tilletia controversa]ABI95830.1 ATP synthase F0 subunit 8 [Tilletia indica]ABP03938.1 ATP8 [Tilletia walkeri]APT42134.1 ATP synthase F0 subunit 8 [Tilletia indica]WEX30826.1 ATP synthase F0 subunit 8 [Tilletia controversa]